MGAMRSGWRVLGRSYRVFEQDHAGSWLLVEYMTRRDVRHTVLRRTQTKSVTRYGIRRTNGTWEMWGHEIDGQGYLSFRLRCLRFSASAQVVTE